MDILLFVNLKNLMEVDVVYNYILDFLLFKGFKNLKGIFSN